MSQLLNHITVTEQFAKPSVGDAATIVMYTDRHAATVASVSKSGKTITIRRDRATRIDRNGMSEVQKYTYEADPTAPEQTARLTKSGWRIGGRHGRKVLIGVREEYRDFSF